MRTPEMFQVETGVHLVTGSNTNWVIVQDGDAVTLVDTGYPGDRELVLASLRAVGAEPSAVTAVLVTHAHSDHIGSAEYLRTEYEVPVLAHREEVPHARRDFLQQVSVGQIAANGWRPGVLPWAVHALRSGGKKETPVAEPREFPSGGPLDVPGRPVPVHTPGHTDGHCAYHLPDRGILVTGDALVSGHPTSGRRGPQLLPRMFHHDRGRALDSLSTLAATGAEVLLPGHGPVHRGPVGAAVEHAREQVG
ncbi:MBL fold metallo-hydrolase [Streptomyces sp. CNQ085]|uniref:MBL fold metallo-hydrolase n=1 Tax=Streptomyces sp. CNQ085 TaxID=2886944 RepID=UPI001F50AAD8|nr:MBL fold metallo-hydrolase [Streptomyces sp. CNQ085]MCI0382880.1 MBL fold metallo-hydrolase [Streptomyces sp. CNQ085]